MFVFNNIVTIKVKTDNFNFKLRVVQKKCCVS